MSKALAQPGALPLASPRVMSGTHFHALDAKSRFILPARLRPALGTHFYMVLDEEDNIALYPHEGIMDVLRYAENMMRAHPDDEWFASGVERITSSLTEVVVEGTLWRVQVPEYLCTQAGLKKECVTVGILNHAVLWDKERWETTQRKRLQEKEVRRAQASLLRGGAAGQVLPALEMQSSGPAENESAHGGTIRGTGTGDAVAPAGDGSGSVGFPPLQQRRG